MSYAAQYTSARAIYNEAPNMCLTCETPIICSRWDNPHDVKRKKFHNRSCAARYNNRLYPKKVKKEKMCASCLQSFTAGRSALMYCPSCWTTVRPRKITNGVDVRMRGEVTEQQIRSRARKIYKGTTCEICGYAAYTEVCHIKPIREFLQTDLVSQINNPANLIRLCPNHHKEMDLGIWVRERGIEPPTTSTPS